MSARTCDRCRDVLTGHGFPSNDGQHIYCSDCRGNPSKTFSEGERRQRFKSNMSRFHMGYLGQPPSFPNMSND